MFILLILVTSAVLCDYFFLRINGVPACANDKLLTDILRNEWGFKGYVVSDQGALGKDFSFCVSPLILLFC